jgi:hypothetical protein
MNGEIGAEAALFPEKEYINGIAVAVRYRWSWMYVYPALPSYRTLEKNFSMLAIK